MAHTTSIDQLVDQLCTEGYHFGAPSELVGHQDAAESERIPCPKCGGSVTYLGFHMQGSYRAFTICNDCGHLTEF